MDKTIGKRLSIFLLFFTYIALGATVSLQLTDRQGQQLDYAQAGEPFLLVVLLSDLGSDQQEPKISGVQDFAVQRVGYRMATINGKKTVHYTYQVRIDKPGTYLLGPAYDPDSNKRSQTIKLKVEADNAPTQKRERRVRKDAQTESVLLRLWTDANTAFVGQKIKTTLRFYVPEDAAEISVDQIISNDPATISTSKKVGPRKGREEIEGVRYLYYEWQWDIFAQMPGDLVVPAYALDYTKHISMDNYLGTLAVFFGPRYERKKVYSNALTIKIHALPDTDKPVEAIGRYVSYRAHIHPAVVKQYEGMVLSLALEGDGNIEQLSVPELQDMPSTCKWYASKNYVEELPIGQRRTFEYIVQGLEEGDWHVPEQSLFYFDVDARTYKELQTAPVFFTVMSGSQAAQLQHAQAKSEDQQKTKTVMTIQPIFTDMLDHQATGAWSWYWFFIILLLPLCMLLCNCLAHRANWIMRLIMPHYAKKRAFVYAHKRLAQADRHHDMQALYAIFVDLFAMRTQRPSLTTDDIQNIIMQSALSDGYKQRWQTFFAELYEAAYAQGKNTQNVQRLFHDAASWLQELQRII